MTRGKVGDPILIYKRPIRWKYFFRVKKYKFRMTKDSMRILEGLINFIEDLIAGKISFFE
jgi:hypothetical protein